MHPEARHFTLFVRDILYNYFLKKKVLDVGGGDINGNNRHLFNDCDVIVNDVCNAPNVTIISKTKDLPFENDTFDTIISTECFEHDPEYKDSFLKIYDMLKPNGLFVFTCASTGRDEHGTRRNHPDSSFGTISNIENMIDYYKNLTEKDLDDVLCLDNKFIYYDCYYNEKSYDLYFVGIKKSNLELDLNFYIPKYLYPYVKNTKSNTNNLICNINELDDVFLKYNTDKNALFHNYLRQYNDILNKYKEKNINLLEIGVFKGESLKSWRNYFNNAKNIVGLDINKSALNYQDKDNNINIHILNSSNIFTKEFLKAEYDSFDIIIDDGSHIITDVIQSFENLFNLVSEGGVYIVEDTICYKHQSFINNSDENHLSYFYKLTNFLNQWRYDSHTGIRDNCVDSFKIMKTTSNLFERSIDKIEYGCSYIAIYKKTRYHWCG